MTIKRSTLYESYRSQITAVLKQRPPAGLQVMEVVQALGMGPDRRRWVRDQLRKMAREGLVLREGRHYRLPGPTRDAATCRAFRSAAERGSQGPTSGPAHGTVAPPPETTVPEGNIVGVLQQHPSGRAFVARGEALDDVLVLPGQRGGALDGDTVEVELDDPSRGRQTGRVLRALRRGRVRLTGVLQQGRIDPDDPRILAPVELDLDASLAVNAQVGDAVLAHIVGYPDTLTDPIRARVERRLGEPGLLLTEVAKCIAGGGIDEDFPDEVLAAASQMPGGVRPEDLQHRLDLRHLHFVTIDPLTARDFDDAVAVEAGPRGTTRVWIAVADVSHYVTEGSVLDRGARQRGCSIYLPDRAIPMLPPDLSSGLCSLVPHQDRLAMTVQIELTPQGEVVQESCAAAVIHSHGQLDYGGVAAALQGEFAGRRETYREHVELLDTLQRVATALHHQRLRRGSLELDLPEAQVQLDQDDPNRVRDVVQSRPDAPIKRAYNLIEELMVAANEAVGRMFQRANQPSIWRIHGVPRPEAVENLRGWVASYGLRMASGLSESKTLSDLVRQLSGHRAARPLSYLVLRTLKQAVYSVTNIGHFGLASPAYLHFTSPIRRYPDLHVHRLVKQMLQQQRLPAGRAPRARSGGAPLGCEAERARCDRARSGGAPLGCEAERARCDRVRAASAGALAELASEASTRERRAIDVEREVQRVYAASLMRDRIGDESWGTISGVNTFGFFVTLDQPFVEGLVRCDRLPSPAEFDPWQLRLLTRNAADEPQVFSLGDRIQVRVADTSVRRRQIDLLPVAGLHEPDPGYVPQRRKPRDDRRGKKDHKQRDPRQRRREVKRGRRR